MLGMRKTDRQQLIKQLIIENEIETQDELIELLKREGVKATQATVSRDVREMSIVKIHGSNGQVKYALFSQAKSTSSEEKLRQSVKDSVIRMERVQFMIVVHTDMGTADVVTNFLDEVKYSEIVGTVAGVDTIIIIAQSEEDAKVIVNRFEEMMK